MTIIYGSNVANGTLTTACTMSSATGGTETSVTSTISATGNTQAEVLSQAGASTPQSSIPATPTGHGWVFSPGAGTFATGNWSAQATLSLSFAADALTMRFFKYSGGSYTLIGSIVSGGTANSIATAKTTYSFAATSMSATTFGSGDLVYVDLWLTDANGNVGGDNPVIYVSNSSSAGVANDMQVTTSTFTPSLTALTVYPVNTSSGVLANAGLLVNVTGGTTGGASGSLIGTATGWGEVTWTGTTQAWASAGAAGSPSGLGALFDGSTLLGQEIITGNWSAALKFFSSSAGATMNGTVLLRFYKYSSDSGVYTAIGSIQVTGQSFTTAGTLVNFPNTSQNVMSFNNHECLYVDTWFNCTSSSGAISTTRIKIGTSVSTSLGVSTYQVITPGYQQTPAKTTGLRTPVRTQVTKSLGFRILARTKITASVGLRILSRTGKTASTGIRTVVRRLTRFTGMRILARTKATGTIGLRTLVSSQSAGAGYAYRKQITLDHTRVSGGADLFNFPVLISRTDADLATGASGGSVQNTSGYDIIFTDSTGATKLDHEIERYTAATGEIEMWVRIPTLSASTDTIIYLYYSNSNISSSQENIIGVWETNFKGVYHLADNATTTTVKDSTSNALSGTAAANTSTKMTTGKVASGLTFNGSSDTISISSAVMTVTNNYTLSCWFNSAALNQQDVLLMYVGGLSTGYGIAYGPNINNNHIGALMDIVAWIDSNYAVSATGVWHHVAMVRAAGTTTFYIDGVAQSGTSTATPMVPTSSSSIGRFLGQTGYFNGVLDEAHFVATNRSPGWISTEYNNQNSPGTFYTVGSIQSTNPQVTRAVGLRTIVANSAPLTLYGTNTASHTLSTANTLVANATGGSPKAKTTLIGTSTGYGEVYSQGNTAAWASAGALGPPSDQGWIYDSIILESQQVRAGNWAPTLRLFVSVGSITADIYVRAWKRGADGTYTQIGTNMVLSGQSIGTGVARYDLPVTIQPGQSFGTGDKLYIGVWLNITANSTGSALATLSCNASGSATLGAANNAVVITPGYQPVGSSVSKVAGLRARVSSLVPAVSALRMLARTQKTLSTGLRLVSTGAKTRATGLRVRTSSPYAAGTGIRIVTADLSGSALSSLVWYSVTALSMGPLVYYRLDETMGTAFDATGNNQQGAITGGVTLGKMGLLTGDTNQAMSFDGITGSITTTIDPTLQSVPQGASAWSMTAWVSLSTTPTATSAIMDYGTRATNQNAALYFDSGGVLHAGFDGAGDVAGTTLALSTPHFVVATYDGASLTLSIDGAAAGAVVTTGALVGTTLSIGCMVDNTAFLAATIDEPKLFPYALSSVQVQSLYQAGITVPPLPSSGISTVGFATSAGFAPGTVPTNNPLGQTMNIPNNHPGMPDQAIIDMAGGTGKGGTVPGWGPGVSIRYQQHWGQATEPAADHVYDWSAVDSTVDRCTAAGVEVLWVLSYPPSQYLTVRASDGVDTGAPGAEYANAATWTYFCRQVAARYNGTSTNALTGQAQTPRLIPELSIYNEEYDEGDHLPRDDQSKWLVPVVQQAAPAIKALHPSVILGIGAVRHTYNGSRTHITNWLTNLFTYTPPGSRVAGIGNLVKWISFHYYRGGGGDNFPNLDPTSSSADMPSIGQQIDLMFATVRPLGFTGDIYCNEFGWAVYDGDKGVVTVSPDVQSQYLFDVIDACRVHGVAKIHIFTLNPGSHVNLANTPPTADAVRSIVQTINNVYTYLPAYDMMVKYHHDHPVWNNSSTPKTRDGMGRFSLVAQTPPPRSNPYGVTLYVDPKANPAHVPNQLLIDIAGGTGAGGTVTGWGKHVCLRWQLHWTDVEPNADGVYDWSRVDNVIDDCAPYGIYLMWPIEYAPDGYLTIRASDGATVAAGTGDLASPATWKTFMRQVAARYNGTTKNVITGAAQTARVLPEVQIGNEEYDQFTPYDFQGTLLGDVAKVAIPAFKAIHPTGRVSLGSVRKKTNDAVAHFGAWLDGLYAHMGGDLADAQTLHYYRGGSFNPDPTTSNHADTPSIAECLTAMQAAITRNGGTAEIYIDEYGWDGYDDGSGTSPVVSLAQQSAFIKDVLDAWRLGGGARANLFWIEPSATVNTTKTPQTSTAIKSITQHINGVYTYLPAYTMITNYAANHPYWGTATFANTRDAMGRFNLVAPGGGAQPLTLYATTAVATESATAGTLATTEGGTQVTMSTLVDTAKNYGEVPALGSTTAWPARAGFHVPDGRGWYLDGTVLDQQVIAAGAWSGIVRLGPPAGTGMAADVYVRLFRYTPVISTYTHIGDLLAPGVALIGLLNATLGTATFGAVTFATDDRLYMELWLNITTPSTVAGTLMHVVETSTAGAGHANNLQIFTPGYSPVAVPQPGTRDGMGRFVLGSRHTTRDGMGRFVLGVPGQSLDGMGRFVLRIPTALSVVVGNSTVPFIEDTLTINQYLDERWRCQLTVLDYAGNQTYPYGARVQVSDQALGPLFSGFVADDTLDKSNTATDPAIEHKIDTLDNRHRADKRTSNRLYTTPTPAGKIVVDMLADVLTAEGVQANYALREDASIADWNAGTLVGTVGAATLGDGDLELSPAGTLVTKIEQVAADWNAGVLAGTMVKGDVLQLNAHPALSFSGNCSSGYGNAYAYYKIWSGGYLIQNGDTLCYKVWVNSGSPEIKAGVDGICTDGTSIRDFNSQGGGAFGPPGGFIFDQNGMRAHPNTDLSGFANDQWYFRQITLSAIAGKTLSYADISLEGDSAGTYQAYFYDIWIQNAAGTITVNLYGNRGVVSPLISLPNLSSKVSNVGYSNIQITPVTAYEQTGTRTSPNTSIAPAGICQSSQVDWLATTPDGTSLMVATSVDGGSTFQEATNLLAITNLMAGASLAGRTVTTRETLAITGKDPTVTPTLSRLFFQVVPSYAATKQDTFKTFTTRPDFLTGTLLETMAAHGDLSINSVQSDWDNGLVTGQTAFGNGAPFQSTFKRAGSLRSKGMPTPGTVAQSRLDFAGAWQNFIMSIDVEVPIANVFVGIEYRQTYFDNLLNTGGYLVDLTPGSFNFGRGTNNNGNAHTSIRTQVFSPALSAADWHTITIVASGTTHTIYLDGVNFWNAVTDTTFQGAGSFALRVYNNSGGDYTCYYDNFGVMPIDGVYPGIGPLFSGPTWTSPVIPLGSFTGGSSLLFWDATTALGDYLNVLTNFNGGGYQNATSGAAIPGIVQGTAYTNATLQVQVQMQAATPADTPVVHGLTAWVSSLYNAVGTRISPLLDLTPVVGRLGSSMVAWNAILATNTALMVEVGNGTTWTDVTANNGGTIPPYAVQPDPTIDTFGANTSANYTSASFSGGTVAPWVWDTAHARLSVSGGTNAVLLATGITAGDVDVLFDTDMSDTLGIVWRYIDGNNCYFLEVHDSLSSSGTHSVVQVWKRAAGVNTQLRKNKTVTFTRGIPHRIRMTMTGGLITVTFSGGTVYTFTDTTPLGAGQVGLRTNGGQGTCYQLRIQPLGDDVTGKLVQTRLTLTSTDPTVTPQVEDVSVVAFDPAIGPGKIIPSTDYRYTFVDKNLDDLAKQSNYSVWFDANVALHFNSRVTLPAPWILASNKLGLPSDIELDSNLAVEVLGDVYRNRQVLTGVTNTGIFQDPFKGNGKDTSFTLGYPIAPGTVPAIILNGNRQTVGLKGTSGFQWYYAEGDPVIAEDTGGTILQDIDSLSISYTGTFTDTVVVDNVPAQAALALVEGGTGIVESVINVSSPGMMYPAAVVYANQLLARYCITDTANRPTGRKIVAKTYRSGLQVGQMVPVFVPEEGIWNGQFLITEIDITVQTQPGGTVLYGFVITGTELPNIGSASKLLASGLLH